MNDFSDVILQKLEEVACIPSEWRNLVDMTKMIIQKKIEIIHMKEEIPLLSVEEKKLSKRVVTNSCIQEYEQLSIDIQSISVELFNLQQIKVASNDIIKELEEKMNPKKVEIEHLKKIEEDMISVCNQKSHEIEDSLSLLNSQQEAIQSLFDSQEKHIREIAEYQEKLVLIQKRKLEISAQSSTKRSASNGDVNLNECPNVLRISKKMSTSQRRQTLDDIHVEPSPCNSRLMRRAMTSFNLENLDENGAIPRLHNGTITCLKFSNSGQFMAVGGEDSNISILNTHNFQTQKVINQNRNILSLDFNSTDSIFMTTSYDGSIRFYDTKSFEEKIKKKNNDNRSQVNHAEFVTDYTYISSSSDLTIKLYDINSSKPLTTLKSRNSTPSYVTSEKSDSMLISAHMDGSIKIWDTRTKSELYSIPVHKSHALQVIRFPREEMQVISLSKDQTIAILDLRNHQKVGVIPIMETNIKSDRCRMALRDSSVIVGGNDGSLFEFSTDTYRKTARRKGHEDAIISVAIKTQENMMVSGDKMGNIKIWR